MLRDQQYGQMFPRARQTRGPRQAGRRGVDGAGEAVLNHRNVYPMAMTHSQSDARMTSSENKHTMDFGYRSMRIWFSLDMAS